jgi:hypothetical protein
VIEYAVLVLYDLSLELESRLGLREGTFDNVVLGGLRHHEFLKQIYGISLKS